jgi:hypothetical protein
MRKLCYNQGNGKKRIEESRHALVNVPVPVSSFKISGRPSSLAHLKWGPVFSVLVLSVMALLTTRESIFRPDHWQPHSGLEDDM